MAMKFIIGKKIGMTRIFDDQGLDYPVTMLSVGPCDVIQIKTEDKEGYSSVQVGYLDKHSKGVRSPEKGHFDKANVAVKKFLKEFRSNDLESLQLGAQIRSDIFEVGDVISITGVSKGKGFAGHMKRHNFGGGRASHGKNSVMRKSGSVGAGTSPGRIWKGTRMAGRMGGENVSIKNLLIVRIDNENNLLYVRGAVPGSKNGIVYISKD